MFRALMIKELRDVLGVAGVALGLYALLVSGFAGFAPVTSIVGGGPAEVPFAGTSFTKMFGFLSFAFAAALGFRQTAWENMRGTFPYLLHRPISRDAIFLTKLIVGAGVFVVCFGVPVLVYALWVAEPGHYSTPFDSSMLEPAWRLALAMPLVYLAAFLSGLRPARWLGTRLLPLAAAVPPAMYMLASPWSWLLHLPFIIALYALFVVSICHVARVRDYS